MPLKEKKKAQSNGGLARRGFLALAGAGLVTGTVDAGEPTASRATLEGVPAGSVLPYVGSTLPPGWLWCDGQELDLKKHPEYQALAEVLRSSFRRTSDPKKTCRLPDLRGRVPLGAGEGPDLSLRALGTQDGSETHTLALEQMPNHHHFVYRHAGAATGPNTGGAAGSGDADKNWDIDDVGDSKHGRTTGVNGRARTEDKTEAFKLMPPFLVLNFIIRYK
jgi:microcystin-dependent protein